MSLEPMPIDSLYKRLSGIIWGDAKTGKTTWAMSLPGRKLLINFDPDGYVSVAHRNDFDTFDLANMPATEAISNAKKVASWIVENGDKYESVIVDSLTTLSSVALEDAVLRCIGKTKNFTPTLEVPGLQGYGGRTTNVQSVVEKIMRATGQKGLHCFFIAHKDDPEFDEDGKNSVQQTLMLSAKIRTNAALIVSEIYQLSLAPGNRRTVNLAPVGHLQPMGSRIFDTVKVPKFSLAYSPDIPDEEQPTSLMRIIAAHKAGGYAKLKGEPK